MGKQAVTNDAILYTRVTKRTKANIFRHAKAYSSVAEFLNRRFGSITPPKKAAKPKKAKSAGEKK